MDFSFSEEQEAVRGLADQIFTDQATPDRVREVEATDDVVDDRLWSELASAGLLGIGLPEAHGGAGLGLIEVCLVLEQQGRWVAPVPYWSTVVLGALPIAEFGADDLQSRWLPGVVDGSVRLTAALASRHPGSLHLEAVTATAGDADDEVRLSGSRMAVPDLHLADAVLVPVGGDEGGLYLVETDGPGVARTRARTTDRSVVAHLDLDAAPAVRLGGPEAIDWTLARARVGLAALQAGVGAEALAQTAAYTNERVQFGKPLATNQAVTQRIADAFIDNDAQQVTLWQAAWRLAEGLPAGEDVLTAAWWAGEGGHRVVHATQHLHGGLGSDIDYPIHRYFLWGKLIGDRLGGPSSQLDQLGDQIAARATAAAEGE